MKVAGTIQATPNTLPRVAPFIIKAGRLYVRSSSLGLKERTWMMTNKREMAWVFNWDPIEHPNWPNQLPDGATKINI